MYIRDDSLYQGAGATNVINTSQGFVFGTECISDGTMIISSGGIRSNSKWDCLCWVILR
jgi:hypothetical protein